MRTAFPSIALILAFIPASAPAAGPPPDALAAQLARTLAKRPAPTLDLVADAGVTPTDDPATTRRKAQAALDALNAIIAGRKRLTIPAGTFQFDRPLFVDARETEVIGDEGNTTLRFNQSSGIFLAIPRAPLGKALTADHLIDATAMLDGTVGKRIGLKFGPDTFLSGAGTGFGWCRGSNWTGRDRLTMEWCLQLTGQEGADNRSGATIGLARHLTPEPVVAILNYPNAGYQGVTVIFGVVGADGVAVDLGFTWDARLRDGVHRIAAQIDLAAGTVACWLDGETLGRERPGRAWGPGLYRSLATSRRVCFQANAASGAGPGMGADWTLPDNEAHTLLGFRLSDGLRYAWGDTLARLDGQPITDRNTYFSSDPITAGYLPLDDDPAEVQADRCVRTAHRMPAGYDSHSTALLLDRSHSSDAIFPGGIRVAGLEILATGDGIVWGPMLYSTIERCKIDAQFAGITNWRWGTNYGNTVADCWLHGQEANLDNYYGMLTLSNLHMEAAGRWGLHFELSRPRGETLFFGPSADIDAYLYLDGSDAVLADVSIDEEQGRAPSVASVLCKTSGRAGGSAGCRADIRDLTFGLGKPGVPIVRLQTEPGARPGWLRLDSPLKAGPDQSVTGPLIECDSDRWTLDLNDPFLKDWPCVMPMAGPPAP